MEKKIVCLLLCVALSLGMVACVAQPVQTPPVEPTVPVVLPEDEVLTLLPEPEATLPEEPVAPETPEPEVSPDLTYIIHACGAYGEHVSTNSVEALENAYALGNRVIEIDFNFTADGYPVCIHDWNEALFPELQRPNKPTLEEYMKTRVYSLYTPMWLETVAEFLRSHPDLYVVTDVKDENFAFAQMILADYPDVKDQFIIQVYSVEDYYEIQGLGFEDIIFTLYALDWETKTNAAYLVEFAKENPLLAYTFPWQLCNIEGYLETMLQAEIPLLIHTVNEIEEQTRFFELGISGIYTDNVEHP